MEIVLFILLSPLLVWNNLTWTAEHEAHWQQTRFDHLEDNFDDKAWKRYNDECIRSATEGMWVAP